MSLFKGEIDKYNFLITFNFNLLNCKYFVKKQIKYNIVIVSILRTKRRINRNDLCKRFISN